MLVNEHFRGLLIESLLAIIKIPWRSSENQEALRRSLLEIHGAESKDGVFIANTYPREI